MPLLWASLLGLGLAACAPADPGPTPNLGWLEAGSPKRLEVDRAEYRHAVYFDTDRRRAQRRRAGPPAGLPGQRPARARATRSGSRATPTSARATSTTSSWRRAAPSAVRASCAQQGFDDLTVTASAFGEALPGGRRQRPGRAGARTAGSSSCSSATWSPCRPAPTGAGESGTDFANLPHSNFGCATQTNLGLMVAEPRDLVRGRALGAGRRRPPGRGHRALPHRQGDRTPGREGRATNGDRSCDHHRSSRSTEQREQFLAFVGDTETFAVIDQVVGEMMLPHASIRQGGVKDAVKHLGEQRSPKLLLIDVSGSDLPLSDINALADVCEPGRDRDRGRRPQRLRPVPRPAAARRRRLPGQADHAGPAAEGDPRRDRAERRGQGQPASSASWSP